MLASMNTAYVLPPGKETGIRPFPGSVLHLGKRESARGRAPPTEIRSFVLRPGIRQGNTAGVIVSGAATDAAPGLAAIKNDDGIRLA